MADNRELTNKAFRKIAIDFGEVEPSAETQEIRVEEIHAFKNHPFRVVNDEAMKGLAENIREHGVLTPVLLRKDPAGGYEMISGHRRLRATQIVERETIPAIVREMDDDEAILYMVSANIQRETVLPSEKARAWAMALEAMKHQGKLTGQPGTTSRDELGMKLGVTGRTVANYIRLNDLTDELLVRVDRGEIPFRAALKLAELSAEEQKDLSAEATALGADAREFWQTVADEGVSAAMVFARQKRLGPETSQSAEKTETGESAVSAESSADPVSDKKTAVSNPAVSSAKKPKTVKSIRVADLKKLLPRGISDEEVVRLVTELVREWGSSHGAM